MKLSEKIYEAWKVGGSGWSSEDVEKWLDDAAIIEGDLLSAEKTRDKLQLAIDWMWDEIYENDSPTLSAASVEKLRRLHS